MLYGCHGGTRKGEAMSRMEQLTLIPEEPLVLERAELPLASLPDDDDLDGQGPDAALVRSIAAHGVLQPVVVRRIEDLAGVRYDVIDGRRRIKAARRAELEDIPAVIVCGTDAMSRALTVGLHATRRDNLGAELAAIRDLAHLGADEDAIARATGINRSTLRARLRLIRDLHPVLFDAVIGGRIAMTVAQQAAGCTAETQARLAARYQETGKLTGQQVEAERRAEVRAAVQALSFADLPGVMADDDVEPAPVVTNYASREAAARALIEAGAEDGEQLIITTSTGRWRVWIERIG